LYGRVPRFKRSSTRGVLSTTRIIAGKWSHWGSAIETIEHERRAQHDTHHGRQI
jgi:hypothetical protein